MPSGSQSSISQRRSPQSMLAMHGPPTKVLSFPAVPAGRESPQPIQDVIAISVIETMYSHLVIARR